MRPSRAARWPPCRRSQYEILSCQMQVYPLGVFKAPLQQNFLRYATGSDCETSSDAANTPGAPPAPLERERALKRLAILKGPQVSPVDNLRLVPCGGRKTPRTFVQLESGVLREDGKSSSSKSDNNNTIRGSNFNITMLAHVKVLSVELLDKMRQFYMTTP